MIKSLLLTLCFALFAVFVYSQADNGTVLNKPSGSVNTYAVVVGISTYESNGIPQLEYAHKDALFFYEFLQSKSGGSVPAANIRLLINEKATYSAIYDAFDWLLTTCHKDDLVYFYFSGHGDMENNTIYKLGFLLSYNTPRTNYINNAVRIEDLNNIANTLSVQINAKVVLITDACHSGKLAGTDNRGTFLVGDQLRATQKKEIRISSCANDQLSAEDQGWGGGRGVFSWYLVNGLEGMADKNKDNSVTVDEIKNYLDTSLATDALLAQKNMKQSPVIKGSSSFPLAAVDVASLLALQQKTAPRVVSQGSAAVVAGSLAPLPVPPQTYFFDLLQQQNAEELLDFTALNKLPAAEIPFACLQMLIDSSRKIPSSNTLDEARVVIDSARISTVRRTLQQNKDALNRFANKLSVLLSDRGQEIINRYLEGDAAELERRRYYNSRSNGYDAYPEMFAVAMKLTPPENYLYHILQIKWHYFSGVAARLKIPLTDKPEALLNFALAEQKKAFALEENAAYIQNELGALYLLRNEPAIAEKYFLRASAIAPQWAVPQANLGTLYANTKKNDKALTASVNAVTLQPELQDGYNSSGLVREQTGHLLLAEELFRKSIDLNSRHYLPFERLGYVYMHTTQYAQADSFFYEADKRKKGFHFLDMPNRYVSVSPISILPPEIPCFFDTLDISKTDVMGNFVWGQQAYINGQRSVAIKKFRQVIALDKTNPLAFHYLGVLLYREQQWEQAAIMFNYAISYALTDSAFERYCYVVAQKTPVSKSRECILSTFRRWLYPVVEDHYFAGRLYEQWNHFPEAEAHYRTIIATSPDFAGGYYLLWNLLEKIGRYPDAEGILYNYFVQDSFTARNELHAFYTRMHTRYPDSGEWYYKAGNFYYNICRTSLAEFEYDRKKIMPDTHTEVYLTTITNARLPQIAIVTETETTLPGILERVVYANKVVYPRTEGIDCLQKAVTLLTDDEEAVADMNGKIGDLCVWQGLAEKALPYYERYIMQKPANAGVRLKLIDIYDSVYLFSKALVQLDSLYRKNEIDFDKRLLLAKYEIHESRFTLADSLLTIAEKIHPYKLPVIADLHGRLQWLSGQPKPALVLYKNYLALQPNDSAALYSIACLYSKTGNKAEGWKWLAFAMEKGFRFGWVLRFDPAWDSYRQQPQWTSLLHKYPPKQYADPAK